MFLWVSLFISLGRIAATELLGHGRVMCGVWLHKKPTNNFPKWCRFSALPQESASLCASTTVRVGLANFSGRTNPRHNLVLFSTRLFYEMLSHFFF